MRRFDEAAFERALTGLVTGNQWQEVPEYYRRYRARYAALLRRFAGAAPARRADVLDIGGGQLAFLAAAMWDDRGCVADIDDTGFAGLRARGIDTVEWNVAVDDPPFDRRFDAIFISEVIAHLPVPGHIVLRRLRTLLRSGGVLLCSTPNLYRLRNVVYLLSGRPLFDHFDVPTVRSPSSGPRSPSRTSRTCRTRRSSGCCPRSAPRCGGSLAIGTTSWRWARHPEVSRPPHSSQQVEPPSIR